VYRELAISFADTLIKFGGLLFHPVGLAWFTLHSRFSSRSIDIQHERDVRDAIADSERIQALNYLAIQLAGRALIDRCGIEEPIGNHASATFERGLNYLADELAPTSLKQKQLGLWRHAGVMRSKLQKLADAFSNRCAPGFTRQDVRDIASLKMRREFICLRGLSASFRALKRDERHLPIVKQSSSKVELGNYSVRRLRGQAKR